MATNEYDDEDYEFNDKVRTTELVLGGMTIGAAVLAIINILLVAY